MSTLTRGMQINHNLIQAEQSKFKGYDSTQGHAVIEFFLKFIIDYQKVTSRHLQLFGDFCQNRIKWQIYQILEENNSAMMSYMFFIEIKP